MCEGLADLVEGDFFAVPVLDVEEHDHSAVLVPTGEDAGVAGLDGAADGLQGQAVEELGVLQPKVHVPWRRENRGAPQGASPSWGGGDPKACVGPSRTPPLWDNCCGNLGQNIIGQLPTGEVGP